MLFKPWFIPIFSLVVLGGCEAGIFGKWFKVAIKAKIRCNGKKYDNVSIQLFKAEGSEEVEIPISSLIKRNGKTEIMAETKQLSTFQPTLHLIHRCGESKDLAHQNVCPMDFWLRIPEEFVFEDSEHGQPYSLTIELGRKNLFDGMRRNCDIML